MDTLLARLNEVSSFVWGVPLILLLVGTGVFFTIRLRGLQFRELKHSLWLALVKRKEEGAAGDISHYQALMTALAAKSASLVRAMSIPICDATTSSSAMTFNARPSRERSTHQVTVRVAAHRMSSCQ